MGSTKENKWYFRSPEGTVYGPSDASGLVAWAREGRVTADGEISDDGGETWSPAASSSLLALDWLVVSASGRTYGPFHRDFLDWLRAQGSLRPADVVYRRWTGGEDVKTVEKIVEKVVERIVEVPVEKVVERIVERPVPQSDAHAGGVLVPEVVEPAVAPVPSVGGVSGADVARALEGLAALEAAAQRELARAGGLKGFFRRKSR